MRKEGISEAVVELVVSVIGWAVCMAMAAGSYMLGSWLAPQFGGQDHREAFGVLSAIAFIWLYEHRIAHERWERLREMIGNINTSERC